MVVLVCVEGLLRDRGEGMGFLAGEVGVVVMGQARLGRLLHNMVHCSGTV